MRIGIWPWAMVAAMGCGWSLATAAEPATTGAAAAASATTAALNVPPEGYIALFNGRDLAGWRGGKTENPLNRWKLAPAERAAADKATLADIEKHWRVEDGELVNDGQGLYLTTARDFGDFELRLEYKTVAKADSGIYLRGIPQVQIWDTTKEGGKWDRNADKGSGALFNNPKGSPGQLPLVHADKPFGQWNSFRITMIGDQVTVYLNEQLVVDQAPMANYYEKGQATYAVGPIQLQTHGGEIRWRNVFLREIPRTPPEAGQLVEGRPAGEGWQRLLGGNDLSGWKYTPENWQLKDGLLIGDYAGGAKHQYLYSDAQYDDFELHALVKMTGDGANSGVCIRTQPTDTDNVPGYQVDMGPGFWGCLWDERRDQMIAAYPKSAADQLVRANDWNHYYIVAQGPYIQAWLNGVKTIDVINPRGLERGSLAFQLCHGKKQTHLEVKDLWIRPLK